LSLTFDDLEQATAPYGDSDDSDVYKPFWAIADQGDEKVLNWLKFNLSNLKRKSIDRVEEYRSNVARYKNLYYYDLDQREGRNSRDFVSGSPINRRYQKVSANHLRDLVNARVARLTRFKPAIAVVPPTNENADELAASMAKRWIDYLWNKNKIEQLNARHAKNADLLGDSFIWPSWDPDKGPIDPDYLDDEEVQADIDGEDIKLDGKPRMGDVAFKLVRADYVHFEPKETYEDASYCFIEEYEATEALKKDFPRSAGDIKVEGDLRRFDFESFKEETLPYSTRKITFYHKPTKHFPRGVEVVFTVNTLLRQRDFPYLDHNDPEETLEIGLPLVRYTSDEVVGEQRGISFVRFIRNLQDIYNSLTTMIVRNQLLAAHPKWIMPAGAANLKSLGNDMTVVQYKGPTPPQLVTFNTTRSETFDFRDKLREEMQQLSLVYGNSRGEPPPGVKSGVAIQFLAEQEQERFNEQVVKWQQYIVNLAEWTVRLIGLHYDKDDKRKIQIIGTETGMDGEVLEFDPEVFKRKFNIRIMNSSALPESKAARIQTALDIREIAPNVMSDEDLVEVLDIGNVHKLKAKITVNKQAADFENQVMKEGHSTEDPAPYEDHLVHYDQHLTTMMDKGYHKWPKARKESFQDHVMAHEMFMYRISKKSEAYAQEIAARFPSFPLFFPIEELEGVLQEESGMVQPVTSPEQGLPQANQMQAPMEGVPAEELAMPSELPQPEPLPSGENAAPLI